MNPNGNLKGINYLSKLAEWDGKSKFTLENLKSVLAALGDPQDRIKSVVVGGTNGKGSVSAGIASMLAQTNEKVGLNISPHLIRLNERVIVDGSPVLDDLLNYTAVDVRKASERAACELSFHEAVTAVAFLTLRESGCSWGVFEVGVGGRLDAANIIRRPEACAIVSIALDHEHVLGSSLAQIAQEKSGIMRSGRLLVTGQIEDEALTVIQENAERSKAVHIAYKREYSVRKREEGSDEAFFESRAYGSFPFTPSLAGTHQELNMGVAICLSRALGVYEEQCRAGVKNLNWPARLEWCEVDGKSILFDCAHNPAGIRSLVSYLKSRGLNEVSLVFGALSTKRWEEMVEALREVAADWTILEPRTPKCVAAGEIAEYLSRFGVSATPCGTKYEDALKRLKSREESRPIVVCGSIYMVGEVRARLGIEQKRIWSQSN